MSRFYKKCLFFDCYTISFLILNIVCSYLKINFGLVQFFIFGLLTLPFYLEIENLLSVIIILSTISYYFLGVYEHAMSLYTLLIIWVIFAKVVFKKRIYKINFVKGMPLIGLSLISYFSYLHSPFGYMNGALRMIYILISVYVINVFGNFNFKKITRILPKLYSVVLWSYAIIITINPSIDSSGRISLAKDINGNTFGLSCALGVCILFLKYVILRNKKGKFFLKATILLGLILVLLSGSRTALMSVVLSIGTVIFIKARREKKLKGTFLKFSIAMLVVISIVYIVTLQMNMDFKRYNYVNVIQSGGTNRSTIYKKLIPYIFNNNFYIYGYGPGHECTRRIIYPLIGRNYTHSHNTFLEAFGELGIIGLSLTLIYVFKSIRNINQSTKIYRDSYMITSMVFCILISSVGESYFYYAIFWFILLLSNQEIYYKQLKLLKYKKRGKYEKTNNINIKKA